MKHLVLVTTWIAGPQGNTVSTCVMEFDDERTAVEATRQMNVSSISRSFSRTAQVFVKGGNACST